MRSKNIEAKEVISFNNIKVEIDLMIKKFVRHKSRWQNDSGFKPSDFVNL